MKIKGLRWWVLGLVVLITIINYLDRGTLNYMWVANTKTNYTLAAFFICGILPYAYHDVIAQKYMLFNTDSTVQTVDEQQVTVLSDTSIQYSAKAVSLTAWAWQIRMIRLK
jgi:ACS family hexuronate transporter-like MFS transporter